MDISNDIVTQDPAPEVESDIDFGIDTIDFGADIDFGDDIIDCGQLINLFSFLQIYIYFKS